MRQYAFLKEPLKNSDGSCVYKIMLYETEGGFYLFEYDSPNAIRSSSDRLYLTAEDLFDDWNDLIDERGWTNIEDPLPDCQHDAFLPVRVKGRDIGKPEWGKYEILIDGEWKDVKGDCK